MPTKLKKPKFTSVDLVRAGANQEADILLRKSAKPVSEEQPVLDRYREALFISIDSILGDTTLGNAEKRRRLDETAQQFVEAVGEVLTDDEEPEDPATERNGGDDPDRYETIEEIERPLTTGAEDDTVIDRIEEIQKFNPYHDERGRFSTADGASSFSATPGKSRAHDLAIERELSRHRGGAQSAGVQGPHQAYNQPPKPEAKEKGKLRKGLVDGLGETHAKAIEKLVQDNAPKQVKDLWEKYGDGVKILEKNTKKDPAFIPASEGVRINIEKDAKAGRVDRAGVEIPEYEESFHEFGHNIDYLIRKKTGIGAVTSYDDYLRGKTAKDFSTAYNDGEFEKSLINETDAYIKSVQKRMSESAGKKVSIVKARSAIATQTHRDGSVTAGDVADILGGATKGKIEGVSGHVKTYWTGKTVYGYKLPGHSVAIEAFAEMFSASITNPASLGKIKEVFPESYKIFLKMCEEAAK